MDEIESRAQFEAWLADQFECSADDVLLHQNEDSTYVSKFTAALCEAFCGGIAAALSAEPKVPEGWVLVPVKPSDSMVGAGCMELADSLGGYESGQVYMCWSAMLAAKPEPKA